MLTKNENGSLTITHNGQTLTMDYLPSIDEPVNATYKGAKGKIEISSDQEDDWCGGFQYVYSMSFQEDGKNNGGPCIAQVKGYWQDSDEPTIIEWLPQLYEALNDFKTPSIGGDWKSTATKETLTELEGVLSSASEDLTLAYKAEMIKEIKDLRSAKGNQVSYQWQVAFPNDGISGRLTTTKGTEDVQDKLCGLFNERGECTLGWNER
jgi:hypothetical protein